MFSLITDAYNVLHDRVLRAEYDLAQGFVEKSDANLAALHVQQRVQAQKDIELMQVTYESRRAAEDECRGVVVVSAVYGALQNYVNTRRSIAKSATGSTLDVTVQVQCAIEASTLYVEGGVSKVAALRGMFNPCAAGEQPGVERDDGSRVGLNRAGSSSATTTRAVGGSNDPRLCVRYLFRGKQHQASVGDCEELKIPMRSHQLAASQQFKIRRRKKKKNRRNHQKHVPAAHKTSFVACGGGGTEVVAAAVTQKVGKTDATASAASAFTSTTLESSAPATVQSKNIIDNKEGGSVRADSKAQSRGGANLSFVLVLAAAMAVGVYFSRTVLQKKH